MEVSQLSYPAVVPNCILFCLKPFHLWRSLHTGPTHQMAFKEMHNTLTVLELLLVTSGTLLLSLPLHRSRQTLWLSSYMLSPSLLIVLYAFLVLQFPPFNPLLFCERETGQTELIQFILPFLTDFLIFSLSYSLCLLRTLLLMTAFFGIAWGNLKDYLKIYCFLCCLLFAAPFLACSFIGSEWIPRWPHFLWPPFSHPAWKPFQWSFILVGVKIPWSYGFPFDSCHFFFYLSGIDPV